MTVFPHDPSIGSVTDEASLPDELSLFSRVEGLVGQEEAFLKIPEGERSEEQRAHLQAISRQLDEIWHKLQARAEARAEAVRP
jgi:hypothetical protein